jgi:hypothetical protein
VVSCEQFNDHFTERLSQKLETFGRSKMNKDSRIEAIAKKKMIFRRTDKNAAPERNLIAEYRHKFTSHRAT